VALMVSESTQNLFLVLTGEQWPDVDEDLLHEAGLGLKEAEERLRRTSPDLQRLINDIRAGFTGVSAAKFVAAVEPFAADYLPATVELTAQVRQFLLDTAAQVQYVKLISVEELLVLAA